MIQCTMYMYGQVEVEQGSTVHGLRKSCHQIFNVHVNQAVGTWPHCSLD